MQLASLAPQPHRVPNPWTCCCNCHAETILSSHDLHHSDRDDNPSSAVLPSYNERSPWPTLGFLEFGTAQISCAVVISALHLEKVVFGHISFWHNASLSQGCGPPFVINTTLSHPRPE